MPVNHRLGLVCMRGSESFCEKVEYYIKKWNHAEKENLKIQIDCVRFSTGEGKGMVLESVRGRDLFIICDPFNYSVTYKLYGKEVPMSPDEHFQDLKRIISAIGGKAYRMTLIMPMLYESRQHKKTFRESLDCAEALQELARMGISDIVTFDAHDPRVQNAIPLCGFDNLQPSYQMLKSFAKNVKEADCDPNKLCLISPDEGGINRCLAYSSVLNLDIGMFYKRRNLSQVVEGANPIEVHQYMGNDLHGKDVIVVDDIISSGGSMLDTFRELKAMGANRVYAFITFGLFCDGYAKFEEAYQEGLFNAVFITNLNYTTPELRARPWLYLVDMTKYVAYVIDAINHDSSISAIMDPNKKILALMEKIRTAKEAREAKGTGEGKNKK